MRDKLAVVAAPEPERNLSAQIPPAGLLIGLHLPDAFPDAVALGLGEGGRDCQEQLRYPVAGDVAAEIEQVELDAPRLETFYNFERVEGRTEKAIELRRDNDIAALELGKQSAADRTVLDRD